MRYEPAGPTRMAHQRRGLKKMLDTHGVTALLFDPGTGKTATVLDYVGLLALKSEQRETRVLVVAPLAAVDTWVLQAEIFVTRQVSLWAEVLGGTIIERAEALSSRGGRPLISTPKEGPRGAPQGRRAAHWNKAWMRTTRDASGLPVDPSGGPDALGDEQPKVVLEILNVDSFASRARYSRSKTMADVMLDAVKRFKPDLVVVDESHKIKGVEANASRLLGRVSDHVPRRMLLTGTFMPAGPLDVFGQWRFLDPYAFGPLGPDGKRAKATFGDFKARYSKAGGFYGKGVKSYQNLDEMQRILSQYAVVAKKEDALDLPPTTDVTVPVHLTEVEQAAYKDMVDALSVVLDEGTTTALNRLTQMMRLRQITSGYIPADTGNLMEVGRSKVSTIASLVKDVLTGEPRIVIFAHFTHEIEMLSEALTAKGTEVMVIGGETPVEERARLRHRFGSNDPQRMVMVAQIKTMSLAVNELVTANHAIFASLSWQRDDLIQARDRLDRMGQTRPVTFWYCLAPDTVDEVIMQSHRERTNLEDVMLKHIADVHAQPRLRVPNPVVTEAIREALGVSGMWDE